MKEHSIILEDWALRAILFGQKTQVRLIVENVPKGSFRYDENDDEADTEHWLEGLNEKGEPNERYHSIGECPYGKIGGHILVSDSEGHNLLLEITDVRVERLQDITRGDAMSEGCPFQNLAKGDDPRNWYKNLWESIYGIGSWGLNPWVWVIDFKGLKNG